MRAASEMEQQERRRKPWMQIEVRGGGGFLVLGGALIAAGLGAAFAAHRARVTNKRSRPATTQPADEGRKGISCNGEGGQLAEVHGDAARGLASLLALDPILSTPTVKLPEDRQGDFSVDGSVETQKNIAEVMLDQSPSFKHLEIGVAAEVGIVETNDADGGDNVVQELSIGANESGTVRNQKEQSSEESELVNELGGEDFSFSVVEFTGIQDKNKHDLEESDLGCVRIEEGKDDSKDEETPSSEEEEFSFKAVESDAIQNQTKQTLEELKNAYAREQEGGGGGEGEESNDDIEAPSSESEEDEIEIYAKGESEGEEEGSDGTRASSIESSAEAVWPAEVIEQEKDSLFLEEHQEITEESCEEKGTAVQAEVEIEEYEEKFAEKVVAAEESVGKKIEAGPKTIKRETEIGLMPVNYSNRFLLLVLAVALAFSLISFVHHHHLHNFCLAKLYHHLYQVFFPSHNTM